MTTDARVIESTLVKALELLDGGKNWTQGAMFRYSPDFKINEGDVMLEISSFCSLGAIQVATDHITATYYDAADILIEVIPEGVSLVHVYNWNDQLGRTWSEVEAMFDAAILLAHERVMATEPALEIMMQFSA